MGATVKKIIPDFKGFLDNKEFLRDKVFLEATPFLFVTWQQLKSWGKQTHRFEPFICLLYQKYMKNSNYEHRDFSIGYQFTILCNSFLIFTISRTKKFVFTIHIKLIIWTILNESRTHHISQKLIFHDFKNIFSCFKMHEWPLGLLDQFISTILTKGTKNTKNTNIMLKYIYSDSFS